MPPDSTRVCVPVCLASRWRAGIFPNETWFNCMCVQLCVWRYWWKSEKRLPQKCKSRLCVPWLICPASYLIQLPLPMFTPSTPRIGQSHLSTGLSMCLPLSCFSALRTSKDSQSWSRAPRNQCCPLSFLLCLRENTSTAQTHFGCVVIQGNTCRIMGKWVREQGVNK